MLFDNAPALRVYSPEKLDSQLNLATRSHLATDAQIVPGEKALHLSSIFKWFQADFGGREGAMEFLLAHYPRDERRDWLMQNRGSVRLRYSTYDWRLNNSNI